MDQIKAFVFDLDGVLVDTAKFHFLAWRRLARELGGDLSSADNERLKGVSRMVCLDIILSIIGAEARPEEKLLLADKKNAWYREYLRTMDPGGVLPGAREFVTAAREAGFRTAIASASRNTPTILEATGIASLFDAVADGNKAVRAKPAPDVFLVAARELGIAPEACIVFEDAAAGIEGAIAAGMGTVGIGETARLPRAGIVLHNLVGIGPAELLELLAKAEEGRGAGGRGGPAGARSGQDSRGGDW